LKIKGRWGGEPPALGDFLKFVAKTMHFRHISAKIQPKNLKQHIDWGAGYLGPPLATPLLSSNRHILII